MLADILFSMVGPLLSLYIPRAVSSPFIVFSFVHNSALWSLSQAWPNLETVHTEFVAMQRTSSYALCALPKGVDCPPRGTDPEVSQHVSRSVSVWRMSLWTR